ncbi:hypothetical protein ADICYQ_4586 [Cyclobacterium qasimii M12-11B]|uniref:Uncharacterized protein n=1 Tax=Cyclobacterium qasimii M12-11B TaxID=641524 RepID=S7VA43_9BACT|nr:hypothetical protein ADICYQ_4586 [Cyclobacterium qasimii M12-11B]
MAVCLVLDIRSSIILVYTYRQLNKDFIPYAPKDINNENIIPIYRIAISEFLYT